MEHRLLFAAGGPEFSSIQTFGGIGDTVVRRVITDAIGTRYQVGTFSGTVDFAPGKSRVALTSRGGTDVFVAKYSATNQLVWVAQLGGSGNDEAGGISFGKGAGAPLDDNITVVGGFTGTVDFAPGRSSDLRTSNGKTDAFAWSLSPSGKLNWARTAGGSGYDVANDVDGTTVGGSFRGTVNFRTGRTAHVFTSRGGRDGFVWRLSGDTGTFGAFSQVGGTGDDAVEAVTSTPSYDANGRTLLVAGTFFGPSQFGVSAASGAQVQAKARGDAAFASYYTSDGDLEIGALKTYDAPTPVRVADVEPTPTQDYVLISAGSTGSRDLVLWNLLGASAGTQTFDVSKDVTSADLHTDGQLNLWMTGTFSGTATFASGVSAVSHGGSDVLLAKFTPETGVPVFATAIGGTGNDRAGNLANAYTPDTLRLVGAFRGTVDFDPGTGVQARTAETGDDAWLLTFFAYNGTGY